MAQLKIRPESLIQQINEITEEVKGWEQLPKETLLRKPEPKKWNLLEILGHMIMAYRVYQPQIDSVLEKLPNEPNPPEVYTPRSIPKMFINMLRPKAEKIRWKMKTIAVFEPKEASKGDAADVQYIFEEFYAIHNHMKEAIVKMRTKNAKKKKVVSGIGPIVKFYLPEAFAFILAHEERHMIQAKHTLTLIGAAVEEA